MAHEAGKGSKPRPFSVSQAEWDSRWDAIFSRDLKEEDKKSVDTAQESQYNTTEQQKD
jgi:pyruvate dehydrogenase complex dehydrogenase (E1) component